MQNNKHIERTQEKRGRLNMTNEKIRVKANRIVVKLRSLELKALLAEYHADSHTHNTDKKNEATSIIHRFDGVIFNSK